MTSSNRPPIRALSSPTAIRRLTDLQAEFGTKGFGYAGVDLYAGGALTANAMLAKGLKSGDEAMVYGVFSQAERGQSEKSLADTLEKAGLKVDRLEITQEVNSDTSLGMPQFVGLHPVASEPEGDRHAARRRHRLMQQVLQKGGQEAGRHHRRRHRSRSCDDRRPQIRLYHCDARSTALLQGFMPVVQCVMTAKYKMPGLYSQHWRRHGHAANDRHADQADRRRHSLTRIGGLEQTNSFDRGRRKGVRGRTERRVS